MKRKKSVRVKLCLPHGESKPNFAQRFAARKPCTHAKKGAVALLIEERETRFY
jgi:hypothetical protein